MSKADPLRLSTLRNPEQCQKVQVEEKGGKEKTLKCPRSISPPASSLKVSYKRLATTMIMTRHGSKSSSWSRNDDCKDNTKTSCGWLTNMKMAPEVLVNPEERERVETRESDLRSDRTQKIPQETEVVRNSESMLGGTKTVLAQGRELMKVPKSTWKSIPSRVTTMSTAQHTLTRTYSLLKRQIRFGHITKHLRRMPSGDSRTGLGSPTFHSPCGNLYSSINMLISEKSMPFGVEMPQTRPLCMPHSTSSLLSIKLNLKD